jgi:hypothetical protein
MAVLRKAKNAQENPRIRPDPAGSQFIMRFSPL